MLFNFSQDVAVTYLLLATIAGATPIPSVNDARLGARETLKSFNALNVMARSQSESPLAPELDPHPNTRNLGRSIYSSGPSGLFIRADKAYYYDSLRDAAADLHNVAASVPYEQKPDAILNHIRYLLTGIPTPPKRQPSIRGSRSGSPAAGHSSRPASSHSSASTVDINALWNDLENISNRATKWKKEYEEFQLENIKTWRELLRQQADLTMDAEKRKTFQHNLERETEEARILSGSAVSDLSDVSKEVRDAAQNAFTFYKSLAKSGSSSKKSASATSSKSISDLEKQTTTIGARGQKLVQEKNAEHLEYMETWHKIIKAGTEWEGTTKAEYQEDYHSLVKTQIKYTEGFASGALKAPKEVQEAASKHLEFYKELEKRFEDK